MTTKTRTSAQDIPDRKGRLPHHPGYSRVVFYKNDPYEPGIGEKESEARKKENARTRIDDILKRAVRTRMCVICKKKRIPVDMVDGQKRLRGTTCGDIACLTKALLPKTNSETIELLRAMAQEGVIDKADE